MKKILSIVLLAALLISALTACNGGNGGVGGNVGDGGGFLTELPDGMSGKDAVRLLLAGERLDAELFHNEGSIFDNGVEVMNTLAARATENLGITYLSARAAEKKLTLTPLAREVIEPDGGNDAGKLEKEGDTFYFSEFEENNNSYDYFENLTSNIVTSAEIAADLIDNVKKNVRVVDKWVNVHDTTRYFLHVEENSELLIEHYTGTDGINALDIMNICLRYRNAEGKDVYELYRTSVTERYEERMTYIPGERYELSMKHHWDGREGMDCFVADNSKGYWENCVLGIRNDYSSVSYFVMKDDLCYGAFYSLLDENISLVQVMSADRATDLFHVMNHEDASDRLRLVLKFSGFDGIDCVVASGDEVDYSPEYGYANIPNGERATVRFTSGKTAKYGDTFANGKVNIGNIHVIYGAGGYTGEMIMEIQGENRAAQMAAFGQFLGEVGLTCRRDMDGVIAGMEAAFVDAAITAKYYKWNGVSVANEAGISAAKEVELARFAAMAVHYTDVKDVEEIDINDTARMELNIRFAAITDSRFEGVVLNGTALTVGGGSLTITDTLLYVKDEPYKVAFALADAKGGLVHLEATDAEAIATTPYADEESFTVTASASEFAIPMLAPGTYTLVAYIATSDGVRSSAYTPVAVGEITGMPVSAGNVTLSAAKGEADALTLTYAETVDVAVAMVADPAMDCAKFKTAMRELAFEYGTPSDVVEVLGDDGSYAPLGEETVLAYTTYRIAYKVANGDRTVEGYVYVDLVAE